MLNKDLFLQSKNQTITTLVIQMFQNLELNKVRWTGMSFKNKIMAQMLVSVFIKVTAESQNPKESHRLIYTFVKNNLS